ncbi:MAG: universal stress protein [Gammaproteobacteria bacterium]
MIKISRILCPVDFSETSKRAFEYGLDLAGQLGAELDVIHVFQLPAYTLPEGGFEFTPNFETELSNRLQRQLDEFIKQPAEPSVKITTALYEGIPYVEITRAAKKRGADLIVIGTHGRAGFAHLLIGSVAERVVRISEVPVLSIRS